MCGNDINMLFLHVIPHKPSFPGDLSQPFAFQFLSYKLPPQSRSPLVDSLVFQSQP